MSELEEYQRTLVSSLIKLPGTGKRIGAYLHNRKKPLSDIGLKDYVVILETALQDLLKEKEGVTTQYDILESAILQDLLKEKEGSN